MAIAHVASTVKEAAAASGDVTTSAIDTTGADLIVVAIARYVLGGASSLSDSKGNTWTPLTARQEFFSTYETRLYYCAAPTVGTGHTFTASDAGSASPCIAVVAVSGAHASPFDQENGAGTGSGGATSIQPGSITPSENDCLVVTSLCIDRSDTPATDGSYTEVVTGNGGGGMGGGLSWDIQTSAAATNPTWTWGGANTFLAAAIASFKAAGGGAVVGSGLLKSKKLSRLSRVG